MRRLGQLFIIALVCLAPATFPLWRVSAHPAAQALANLDWPYYGHDLGNMRYVDVDQINPSNVGQLKPAWIFHTNVASENTSFESQPIIVDGTLYVSSPHGHVFALDPATGSLKWTYNPDMPPLEELAICCGQTNRGVAVGQGKVFIGQLDAMLVALDAKTGRVDWKVLVDDWRQKWTETMAPQYADGKVLIGASGGEFMRRGHISAYDADTGKMLWRFYTVPGPGEFGFDTWAGDSWKTGGATVWTTPSVDPELGMVYLSTGNAAPDLDGSKRAGQNLFAASVVALDLDTGQYRWHFQEVHHDIWDYDGPQPTHLFTLEKDGQQIPAIGHANKNGYYFILDRRNGQPLYPVREVPVPTEPAWQNPWPTQPEPAIEELIPHTVLTEVPYPAAPFWTPPQEQPLVLQPGAESGPEWPPAAYSPRTKYTYIPAGGYEPWSFHAVPGAPSTLGSLISDHPSDADEDHWGLFDALDTTTGKIAWQMKVPQRMASGAVVAGDLVFFGESNGKFHAVDAKTGKVLWTYYEPKRPGVGGANGAPAVYVANGRQFVVNAFGGNTQVRDTQLSPTGDALIAFALPQPGQNEPNVVRANPRPIPEGGIPHEALEEPRKTAPPDARVVTLEMKEIAFHPNNFTAQAGEKLAIHLVNREPTHYHHNIVFQLPTGYTGIHAKVAPGEDVYFVFTVPKEPGSYPFWCHVGEHQELGMHGVMVVAAAGRPAPPAAPPKLPETSIEGAPLTFPETGYSLEGDFLHYWRANGGLPVFGYPIGSEQPVSGQVIQPFERAVFELHPQNPAPYGVLLRRLGVEALERQGIDWRSLPKASAATPHYFAATSHAIAPQFWDYWRSHGLDLGDRGVSEREALALFGYPISEARMEANSSGDTMLTQWFERARLEYHPTNPEPYKVLLGRLGADLQAERRR